MKTSLILGKKCKELPALANGYYIPLVKAPVFKDSATALCNPGFVINKKHPSLTVICHSDGNWKSSPGEEEIDPDTIECEGQCNTSMIHSE